MRGGTGDLMRLRMNDYERRWDNGKRRWVYTHRQVMAEKLGRPLESGEHVHHINGNQKDNRPENLEIVSLSTHMSKHSPVRQRIWRPMH